MRGIWIKNTVLFAGIALSTTALLAQQAATPAQDTTTQSAVSAASSATPDAATNATSARPQLSAEQKKQLSDMRASERDQAAIIHNDQTLSADQKKAKLQALHASTREQMKSILTPEQQQAFAARRSAGAAKLGLTDDQKSKLKSLFQSSHQQREAVLKNTSLSNEQKQTQLAQIRQTTQTQLATILSPDQLEKFQQMRHGHGHAKQS